MTPRIRQLMAMAVTVVACVILLHASSASAVTLLKEGSRGPAVLTLQQQLQRLGYFNTTPTGYYGPVTKQAVTSLQRDYNLKPDGIAGAQTNQLISQLLGPHTKVVGKEVFGFYVDAEPGIPSSFGTLQTQRDKITSVAPFWYRLDGKKPGQLEKFSSATEQEINRVVSYCKTNQIKVYALVHSLLYGQTADERDVVHNTLANPGKRWDLVMNIFYLLKNKGFDGVCIDIENIYPGDRGYYLQFLRELSAQLKPAGFKIIACVNARVTDKPAGGWGDNFDYAGIGKYADLVAIMAYAEHTAGGKAGPIASRPYVQKVIQYALTKLPPGKILLGVGGFGFDWNHYLGTSRYLSHWMAMEIARSYGKSIQWDSINQTPYFQYVDKYGAWHSVHFENASSLAAKLDLVNYYQLGGIAIWRLGMEDPASWRVIAGKFNK